MFILGKVRLNKGQNIPAGLIPLINTPVEIEPTTTGAINKFSFKNFYFLFKPKFFYN